MPKIPEHQRNLRKNSHIDPQNARLLKHAIFVRWMEKHGLADCIGYFPEDMTLSRLWAVPPAELTQKFEISRDEDCERIARTLVEKGKWAQSDNEVSCSLSRLTEVGKFICVI